MPLYNTATVASAIGVTPKWLDNLLSHNKIAGVQGETQGVSRRLSLSAVTHLLLTKEIMDAMDLGSSTALTLARQLLASPNAELAATPLVRIAFDPEVLRADVLARLARAVELVPTPRRGRPPKR